jgi:hypothetical protein
LAKPEEDPPAIIADIRLLISDLWHLYAAEGMRGRRRRCQMTETRYQISEFLPASGVVESRKKTAPDTISDL